jgi:hypothetical protein
MEEMLKLVALSDFFGKNEEIIIIITKNIEKIKKLNKGRPMENHASFSNENIEVKKDCVDQVTVNINSKTIHFISDVDQFKFYHKMLKP